MTGNFQIELRICESVGMLVKFSLFWLLVQYRIKKAKERGEEIHQPDMGDINDNYLDEYF